MTESPAARIARQVEFIVECDKLKEIFRQTINTKSRRAENDAEHSWHFCLCVLVLAEHANAAIDVLRVLKMLIVHDLVEIDAGDTFAYDVAAMAHQHEREAVAAERIFGLLPPDQAVEFRALWDEFEDNQRRLRENAQAQGVDRKKSPPREGPALLQGLAICGVCGERMTVRYNYRDAKAVPMYTCQRNGIERAEPICQSLSGQHVDEAVGQLLVEAVTPLALEATLTVQQELQSRLDEAEHLRDRHVERARYEADLARRRFMQVDPDNRLVADELEAEWNRRLRTVAEAQEEAERQRDRDRVILDQAQRARIVALAADLPRLWHEPTTPDRERKRMARLLIEDVTLAKGPSITVHVRFRGGATTTLQLPPALAAWQVRQTSPDVVTEIDTLLDEHTDAAIAAILNERGYRSGTGKPFHALLVGRIRSQYHLRSRYDRLRAAGMLDKRELAKQLNVAPETIKIWRRAGLLRAHAYNDKAQCLFEPAGPDGPIKYKHKKLLRHRRAAARQLATIADSDRGGAV